MSKRTWSEHLDSLTIPLLISGFILLSLLFWNQYSTYKDDNSEERKQIALDYESNARQGFEACGEIIDASAKFACVAQATNSQHDGQTAQKDLAAQHKMAEFALGVLFVSIIGAAFSIVGSIFVIFSLKEARKANRIIEKSNKRESRAYINVPPPELVKDDSNQGTKIRIRVENRGQTPAYQLMVKSILFVGKDIQSVEDVLENSKRSVHDDLIGDIPGGTDTVVSMIFTNDDPRKSEEFWRSDYSLSLRIWVEFWDVFESERWYSVDYVFHKKIGEFRVGQSEYTGAQTSSEGMEIHDAVRNRKIARSSESSEFYRVSIKPYASDDS